MNLLDHFVLKHLQLSLVNAELIKVSRKPAQQEARLELNLTPRLMKADSGEEPPSYQVTARLSCEGRSRDSGEPVFRARVGMEAVYEQIGGDPIDLAEFTSHHASLARQLYPLLQHELRLLLVRLGLEQIHLPFDLAARIETPEGQVIEVSGAVH
ncbi:MAG: hypothetical protein PVJ33_11520 [Lysobacterales bacterium]|jgi:hypothetical protein